MTGDAHRLLLVAANNAYLVVPQGIDVDVAAALAKAGYLRLAEAASEETYWRNKYAITEKGKKEIGR